MKPLGWDYSNRVNFSFARSTAMLGDKMLYCASDLIESYILSIYMFMVWVCVQSFYSISNKCYLFSV